MKKEVQKKKDKIIDWKDLILLFLAFAILIMQGLMTKQEMHIEPHLQIFIIR